MVVLTERTVLAPWTVYHIAWLLPGRFTWRNEVEQVAQKGLCRGRTVKNGTNSSLISSGFEPANAHIILYSAALNKSYSSTRQNFHLRDLVEGVKAIILSEESVGKRAQHIMDSMSVPNTILTEVVTILWQSDALLVGSSGLIPWPW